MHIRISNLRTQPMISTTELKHSKSSRPSLLQPFPYLALGFSRVCVPAVGTKHFFFLQSYFFSFSSIPRNIVFRGRNTIQVLFLSFKVVYLDVRIKKPRGKCHKIPSDAVLQSCRPQELSERKRQSRTKAGLLALLSCDWPHTVPSILCTQHSLSALGTGFVLWNSIQSYSELSKRTLSHLPLLLNFEELLFIIPYFVPSFPNRHQLRYALTQKRKHMDGKIGLKDKKAIIYTVFLTLSGIVILALFHMTSWF